MSLLIALLLDAVFGEPKALWNRLPHPAVLMGRCVGWIDRTLNKGANQRLKGAFGFGGLVILFGLLGWALAMVPGIWLDCIVGGILLAQRSLAEHVGAVGKGLDHSLSDGRHAVSMIVSRDTSAMDQSAVVRSAIESGAENLSDGVIAPAFWFAVAGLPGLLIYKITNTADSMIGYRTARHEKFGWAAARFDDLLNLIPARLTALLLWITGGFHGTWPNIYADARRHKSPNAGWPEAAMSRSIGVALAGPRSYDGQVQDFPFVNAPGRRDLTAQDIRAAVNRLWRAWAALVVLAAVWALV